LDEAWFALLSDGAGSRAVRVSSNERKFGAGLATVHSNGTIELGERTFADSVEAADFIFTGDRCTFTKTKDDPE